MKGHSTLRANSGFLQGGKGAEAAAKAAQVELQLTYAALKRNPKSYSTWHHRKLVIQRRLVSLETELALVKE